MEKVAILLDGGYVKKQLTSTLGRFPTVKDIDELCQVIMQHDRLSKSELFRVFFYDAPPFGGKSRNPLDNSLTDFATTTEAQQNLRLLKSLEEEPDFAVRRGVLVNRGWKLGRNALTVLKRTGRAVKASDLIPDFQQKGVDLRIGLDIASMALKGVVTVVIIVSGDSDLVPAMKFARKEGLRVYVAPLGGPIRHELRAHSDFVL